MFLDCQNFAKSLTAFAADVLVKGHMLVRLGVRSCLTNNTPEIRSVLHGKAINFSGKISLLAAP
jgi:hypothetical protein